MNRFRRSGRTLGFLLGVALFVGAPFAVSAAQSGHSFDRESIRQHAEERIQARIAADERFDDREADTERADAEKRGRHNDSFGGKNNFPGKLCPSTIKAGWLSVPVFLPCKNTPPPPPPPPPAPALTFTASPSNIQMGSSSLLSWDSTNATSCTASNGWTGSKSVDGSQSVTPTSTTTYELQCAGAGGTTTKSVMVTVVPTEPEPEDPTLVFTAAHATINEGSTTTLSWDSTNATSCTASNGWSGSKTVDGSEVVAPTATTTYTLTCTGAGGSIAVSAMVNVILDEEPAPEGKVVISEVMYDLTTSTTSPQGSETANEWVEIYNGTNSSIELSNYAIADASSTDPLPAAVLPAGKYAVIVASSTTASFWSIPGDAVIVQLANTTIGNGLGNAADMVSLFDEVASSTIDAVSWGGNTTAFSPSVPAVETNAGHSIARSNVTVDTDTAADWMERTAPNPGQ